MTESYDIKTPWNNFIQAAGLPVHTGEIEPPKNLSKEEKLEIFSLLSELLDERIYELRDRVSDSWRDIGPFLRCRKMFNLGKSTYFETSNATRWKERRKESKSYPSRRGCKTGDVYKMVRSLGFKSVQEALFGEPCDIRCTANDIAFLQNIKNLTDIQRDSLEEAVKMYSDAVREKLAVQEKLTGPDAESYTSLWVKIPVAYSPFCKKYGYYWEYSDQRMDIIRPLFAYRVNDYLSQDTSEGKAIKASLMPLNQIKSRIEHFSTLRFRKFFEMGLATNTGPDDMLLSNPIKDGYGKVYIKNKEAKYWLLDDEERKWAGYIHGLSLENQEKALDYVSDILKG